MAGSLKEKLTSEITTAPWQMIVPHLRRDAVIVIAPGADLAEVGVALAEDDKSRVQEWIDGGTVNKPTAEQLTAWHKNPEAEFRMLIIQPFVLIQEPDTGS